MISPLPAFFFWVSINSYYYLLVREAILTAQFSPSVLAFLWSFPSEEVESIRGFGLLCSVPLPQHCSCDRVKWSGWAPYSSRYVKCSDMYRMLPYLNCSSELSHLAFLGWLSLALQRLSHFCQALAPWFFFFFLNFSFLLFIQIQRQLSKFTCPQELLCKPSYMWHMLVPSCGF